MTVFGSTPGCKVGFCDGIARSPTDRRGWVLLDDEVPERLDLLPADGLGENPVLPRHRHVDLVT